MWLRQGPEDSREPVEPGPECIAGLLLCGALSGAATVDAGKSLQWQLLASAHFRTFV